jgi:hypothetical protein
MVLRNMAAGPSAKIIEAAKKIVAFRLRAKAFPSWASFLFGSG